MKRIVVVAAAGLLTGLGGGTGFKVMTAPPPAEVDGGMAADSTGVTAAEHPTAEPAHESADPAIEPDSVAGADSTAGADTHSAGGGAAETNTAGSTGGTPTVDGAGTTDSAGAEDATAKLSRLLAAMRPEEAARILEPLEDTQVKTVLFALPERKAAAILAKFKGDRAAALARAIIEHAGKN